MDQAQISKEVQSQKPSSVVMKARTTAFNHGKATGNMAEYKQSRYSLHKAIK
jgi:hypothetical protein